LDGRERERGVQLPVEKGADKESEGAKGRTLPSWAAARGHEAVVRLLLENGTDVELKYQVD
jgi:ankyrin repeat protein